MWETDPLKQNFKFERNVETAFGVINRREFPVPVCVVGQKLCDKMLFVSKCLSVRKQNFELCLYKIYGKPKHLPGLKTMKIRISTT